MQLLQCSMVDFVIYQAEFKAAWWDPCCWKTPQQAFLLTVSPINESSCNDFRENVKMSFAENENQ